MKMRLYKCPVCGFIGMFGEVEGPKRHYCPFCDVCDPFSTGTPMELDNDNGDVILKQIKELVSLTRLGISKL